MESSERESNTSDLQFVDTDESAGKSSTNKVCKELSNAIDYNANTVLLMLVHQGSWLELLSLEYYQSYFDVSSGQVRYNDDVSE